MQFSSVSLCQFANLDDFFLINTLIITMFMYLHVRESVILTSGEFKTPKHGIIVILLWKLSYKQDLAGWMQLKMPSLKSGGMIPMTDSYKLLRRDRWGRRGESVALYIKEEIKCEELSLKNGHEQVESLWVTETEATKGHLWFGGPLQAAWSSGACWWSFLLQLQDSCWETSTTLTSAGNIAHWAVGHPQCSWNILRITSWAG